MRFPQLGRRRKQKNYTILFFSDSDAKPRGVKLSREMFILLGFLFIAFISGITLVLVIHTPIKYIVFPETFVESKERAKKLQELYAKLENFAYELERVKLYNNFLRQALGEKVSDSIALNIKRIENFSYRVHNFNDLDFQALEVAELEKTKPRFIFPVFNGFVARGYVPEIQHFGIDIAAREGDVIRAISDGYVIFADWTYRDGYVVIIVHSGGFMSVYKHAKMNLKTKSSFVKQGEAIALVGGTGKTAGEVHLHFELWRDGKPLNPKFYISFPN